MAKHGKKYLAALAKVNIDEQYLPQDAMKLVKETAYT
jgi:large subunit ribosomal protein L1